MAQIKPTTLGWRLQLTTGAALSVMALAAVSQGPPMR